MLVKHTHNKPCAKCPTEDEIEIKKSAIVKVRKYAKKIKEDRKITNIKVEAIRCHDMSTGNIIKVHAPKCTYIFSIK